MTYQLLQGDALAMLRTLPNESVHCGVTSPPYFGLRDYGTAEWDGGEPDCDHKPGHESRVGRTGLQGGTKTAGHKAEGYGLTCGKCGAVRVDKQIGMEPTPDEYVQRLVEVFREVRRVLRADGVLWVNIGDSYNGSGGTGGATEKQSTNAGNFHGGAAKNAPGLKPKNLIGIPWRLAFALQADGWWLRSEIIWAKGVSGQDSLKKRVYEAAIGNGVGEEKARAIASAVDQYNGSSMPESVTDRPSKSHEQLFLFTKSPRYFYDATAIADESVYPDDNRKERSNADQERMPTEIISGMRPGSATYSTRNRRSVWTINPEPTPYAHFATMPTALVEPCILAGTSARGVCPACGAPWVRVVERGEIMDHPARMNRANDALQFDADGNEYGPGGSLGRMRETTTTGWTPTCTCDAARTEAEQLLADHGVRADFPDLTPVPAVVLDPFAGSGTTLRVAINLGRDAIGIELNPEYVALAERLLGQTQPALMGV